MAPPPCLRSSAIVSVSCDRKTRASLLQTIVARDVVDLDAGCCGLAGSFGYEKEHYDVSRIVGEQRLFPALRQAKPGDAIVAPGFSCRLQIRHFTGLTALHPVEYLAQIIGE